jgi:AcrR family transcriptional regulator
MPSTRPPLSRDRVVTEAMALADEQGLPALSMRALAGRLGVEAMSLYHHVPGKEALLSQALDEALDGLTAVLDRPAGTTAYERLRAAVRDSVRVLVEHLPAVTLLLRVRGNSEVELAALRRRREIDDRLAALVSAAAAEGSLRADLPPDLVSRLLFGMVNSLVEWYRPGGPVDADALADALATLAFEGLNTQAS